MSNEVTEVELCSFCDRPGDLEQQRVLIEGEGVAICSECVQNCVDALKDFEIEPVQEMLDFGMKPSEIVSFLDEYVVGQERAKMVLAVAVVNHYKLLDYKQRETQNIELEKSNVLLVGPTGAGKTYFARQLAKILDVPFAIADATTLTEAGYVGEDVENVVRRLLDNADGDIEAAERGIIYIDEIDKLSRKGENPSISRDVSGEGVQQALLKIIEGSEVEVASKGMRKHPMAETTKINTANILFIVGGSFEGIEKIIAKRLKKDKVGIGFGAKVESKEEIKFNDYILDVKAEDLKKFGMLPELLGRLPIITPLKELDQEALVKILTEPKNAIIKQYQELFRYDGITLEFEDEAVKAIADLAIERKTGARSLRAIMEEVLLPYMYKTPDMEDVEKIIFTAEAVRGEEEAQFILKEKDAS